MTLENAYTKGLASLFGFTAQDLIDRNIDPKVYETETAYLHEDEDGNLWLVSKDVKLERD